MQTDYRFEHGLRVGLYYLFMRMEVTLLLAIPTWSIMHHDQLFLAL